METCANMRAILELIQQMEEAAKKHKLLQKPFTPVYTDNILLLTQSLRIALDNLSRINDHIQYLRHVEKRYLEVGKEKYDWAKLNGPLSAIERELSSIEVLALMKEKI